MYLCYLVNHISFLYNALVEYFRVHQTWCETKRSWSIEREIELLIIKYDQNVRHWHEHKHEAYEALVNSIIHQHLLQAMPYMQKMVIYLSLHDSGVMFTSQIK